MSADNWTVCPKCGKSAKDEQLARIDAASAAYGKVSAAEYERLRVEAAKPLPEEVETLREDYDIGIYRGKFSVDYRASCDACGFEHSFKHEVEIGKEVP